MKKGILVATLLFLGLLWPVGHTQAEKLPILFFNFNENVGSIVKNLGSSGSEVPSAPMINKDGFLADLHSLPRVGPSGLEDDRAFDNTASTGHRRLGGRVETATVVEKSQNLFSLTMTLWVMVEDSNFDGNGCFLVYNGDDLGYNVSLENQYLRFQVNGKSVDSLPIVNKTGWVFVAVSYNSKTGNVKFYSGSPTASAKLTSSGNVKAGITLQNPEGLCVGNKTHDNGLPFDGFMDNVGVYGSREDESGELSPAEIEEIRESDLRNGAPSPTPTPLITPSPAPSPKQSPTPVETPTPPTEPTPTPATSPTPISSPQPSPTQEPTPSPLPECSEIGEFSVRIKDGDMNLTVGENITIEVIVGCKDTGEPLEGIKVYGKIRKSQPNRVVSLNDRTEKIIEHEVVTDENGVAVFRVAGLKEGFAEIRFRLRGNFNTRIKTKFNVAD
ncbi:MAG: hypothetical protein L6Q29_04010 [Candidatus Pacebacteria bacterium]|nr:hypothetical protein [Candidatus Paceibacterota bacterium]